MKVIVCKDYQEVSEKSAEIVAQVMKDKPNAVLGLATGSTPEGMYAKLVEMNRKGEIDFSDITTVNLDEYYPISPDNDQSYRYFMDKNLFDSIDIKKSNTHVLNGLAKDWKKEVKAYEAAIKKAGGIDIQVLGIGSDGHIAFNEPGSSLSSRTRLVSLTPQTIKDNSRFFKKAADVPTQALSMGVGSIMESKKVVLLAFGKNKAAAVAAAVEGGVSQFCTASALQMHPDAWFFCDEEAASKLKLKKYYAWRAEGELSRA